MNLYPIEISSDTTVSLDYDCYLIDASAGNINMTLPDMTGMGFGESIIFKRIDTNPLYTVTITATGTTIDELPSITIPIGGNNQIEYDENDWHTVLRYKSPKSGISILIDGQGATPETGAYGTFSIPYSGYITGWTLLECSDPPISSSIVIDVWKDTYANYPPTVADTIWGTKPSLVSATKNTATGLSIQVTQGDTIFINIDSVSTGQKFYLLLQIEQT